MKIGNQRGIIVSDGPEYTVVYWTGTVVNASQESLAEHENPSLFQRLVLCLGFPLSSFNSSFILVSFHFHFLFFPL